MNVRLVDASWVTILAFLRTEPNIYVGNATQTRRFVAAFLWIVRSGSKWRFLPAAHGRWNSIYKRFARWQQRGLWQRLLAHVAAEPDLENIILDSTTVRARAKPTVGKWRKRWAAARAASARKSTLRSMAWATRCACI